MKMNERNLKIIIYSIVYINLKLEQIIKLSINCYYNINMYTNAKLNFKINIWF